MNEFDKEEHTEDILKEIMKNMISAWNYQQV